MPITKKEDNKENFRLKNQGTGPVPQWQKWGPYLSERSWGTVREDYSSTGDAWSYFPFDKAHVRSYRWGEDGIAGWCDRYQVLAFSPAFWNGNDPILKERLFGLASLEGNHGEDVKEYYYYEDGIPTHSYMKYLYRYPQKEFPYKKLREEGRKKLITESEYELVDTGIFEENKYFDIFIEYAKSSAEDFCFKIEAINRGKENHRLDILPQMWFRNQWSWSDKRKSEPTIEEGEETEDAICLIADDKNLAPFDNLSFSYKLGKRYFYGPKGGACLFTDNETVVPMGTGHYKDSFHQRIVKKQMKSPAPSSGTKACFHYHFPEVEAGKSVVLYFRVSSTPMETPLKDLPELFIEKKKEADEFYADLHPEKATEEEKAIQRQACAGVIWSKQIYLYDVNQWLKGDDPTRPPAACRENIRNSHWKHLNSMRIFSMPDKWEYPWFAAWDQAFHAVVWSLIDIEFAKEQLWLLLFDQFQHPSGQIPAYEWEFSDLNPPLQGWACLQIYEKDKKNTGKGDREFLERCFHKLLMNFAWWVNKVDNSGNNLFEGGFLGLDNITVIDRSQKVMDDITLQQADGTGWMAFFCLNLMKMALELSIENNVYESLATKFFEHYVYIAQTMAEKGEHAIEIWDGEDGFFYDVLRHKGGSFSRIQARSLVGIIPVFAVEYISEKELNRFPSLQKDLLWFLKNRKPLVDQCVMQTELNGHLYYVFTPVSRCQLDSILRYVWDPSEFRAEYGLRSLSKYHKEFPVAYQGGRLGYEPEESRDYLKGGNSNWRGPIWFPLNFLLIQSLQKLSFVFENKIRVEVKGEEPVCLKEMSNTFSRSLINIFADDKQGNKPFLGEAFPYQKDPHWTKHYLFYEYFNPDTGRGLGASHQSGWTSLVANLIDSIDR